MDFPSDFDAHGLRLRAYRDEDAPSMVAGLNDPETRRFQQGTPIEMTEERALGWIRASPTRFAPGGDRVVHAVVDPETDELLAGTLMIVAAARASAEIGFWICPAARGRGVATRTARALAELCFAQGTKRVEMLIRWDNVISLRVALAAGFRPEGELRDVIPGVGDLRHDAVLWSRLPTDGVGPVPRVLGDMPSGGISDGMVTLRPVGPGDVAALVAVTGDLSGAPEGGDVELHCVRAPARLLLDECAAVLVTDAMTGEVAGELRLDRRTPAAGRAVLVGTSGQGAAARALMARGVALMANRAFDAGIADVAVDEELDVVGWDGLLPPDIHRDGRRVSRLPGPVGLEAVVSRS